MLTYNYKRIFSPETWKICLQTQRIGFDSGQYFQTDEKDYERSYTDGFETSR